MSNYQGCYGALQTAQKHLRVLPALRRLWHISGPGGIYRAPFQEFMRGSFRVDMRYLDAGGLSR